MSYADEAAAIEGRWFTQWATGSPATARTPTQLESVNFTPPSAAPWVSLTIRNGAANQASAGDPTNNFYRHAGAIMIQVFVPLTDGGGISARRRALDLADYAGAVFRGQNFDGVLCEAPYLSGSSFDGEWYQATVAVPYTRDSAF